MLTPTSFRDWLVLIAITALGVAALVWLLPMTARAPFILPPAMFDQAHPGRKPGTDLMNVTPVAVGVTVVLLCSCLYAAWMDWSTRRAMEVGMRRPRGKD